MTEKLLKLRRTAKAKKPKFIRQDAHKKARLRKCWRKPKGLQSKMRYKRPGYRTRVEVGYGAPKIIEGLTREGLVPVKVGSLKELSRIEEGQGAVISSTVGQRKKVEILKKAKALSIKVLNIKDIESYLKSVEEKIKKKKEEKEKATKEKEKKKAEKEKKAEEKKKEDLAEKLSDEEKKAEEKKEREKILTKKEN
jgi:large subunit ribosomal protein L32e